MSITKSSVSYFSWQLAGDSNPGIPKDGDSNEDGLSVILVNPSMKVVMCDCGKVYKLQPKVASPEVECKPGTRKEDDNNNNSSKSNNNSQEFNVEIGPQLKRNFRF